MAVTINGTTGITTPANTVTGNQSVGGNLTVSGTGSVNVTGTVVMGSSFKRNRIINGNMVTDQRNAGASVTINAASNTYTLDRWLAGGQATDGVFTVQQSATAPSGFSNSIVITVTTADSSISAGQAYYFRQNIEGYNVADLGYGTASAQTATLSFWVRSSVTGTFGGALNNSAFNRSYPFSFTISAANTFEYKTITITGDTSGTWLTTNGIGLAVTWSLGMGSTYKGTASAWSGSLLLAPTGAVDLISTSGATFYITGVQLEVGSSATPYEFQTYSEQLAQCQRYYEAVFAQVGAVATGAGQNCYFGTTVFQVSKRAAPTITTSASYSANVGTFTARYAGIGCFSYYITATAAGSTEYDFNWTASAEL